MKPIDRPSITGVEEGSPPELPPVRSTAHRTSFAAGIGRTLMLGASVAAVCLSLSFGCASKDRLSIAEPGVDLPFTGTNHALTAADLDPAVDFAEDLIGGDSLKGRGMVRLAAFVITRFHGDPKAAFDHYARDDGKLTARELEVMLMDAKVGGGFRGIVAKVIVDKVEKKAGHERDGALEWSEFEDALQVRKLPLAFR
jgi:hypothetical protein